MKRSLVIVVIILSFFLCTNKVNATGEEITHEKNAKEKLKLTSVYGDDEAYHPSILYFKDGWNGYKYWLGFTPYPSGNYKYENPHVKVSNDMKDWKFISEKDSKEALDTPEAKHTILHTYNSDIELVYNDDLDRIECFWRRWEGLSVTLYMRYTTDGKTWSNKQKILKTFKLFNYLLSPSIIYEDGKYKMWYINNYKIIYEEYNKIPFKKRIVRKKLNINVKNEKIYPWHLDIVKNNNKYELIYVGTNKKGDTHHMSLYYTSGLNNENWNQSIKILNPSKKENAWDNRGIYRSSLFVDDDKYYVFYSASNKKGIKGTSVLTGDNIKKLHPLFE